MRNVSYDDIYKIVNEITQERVRTVTQFLAGVPGSERESLVGTFESDYRSYAAGVNGMLCGIALLFHEKPKSVAEIVSFGYLLDEEISKRKR